jgi:hypothetical protein
VVWPEAGKDCGEDLNVNERTQTNVCTALRSPLRRGRRLMIMSMEEREEERQERKGGERKVEKPPLGGCGLIRANWTS